MYRIKQLPEDFIVKEINDFEFDTIGPYTYYLLKKTNYNTISAIKKICDTWKIREKYVNFAGTKDKVAITEQFLSIKGGPKRDLDIKDINLKLLGFQPERLNLGMLKGNYFEITVRNIEKSPEIKNKFLNLFDSQRFGNKNNNQIIGKLILKGKFKEACDEIIETKEYLTNSPTDFIGALRSIPKKILRLYVHAYQSFLWNSIVKIVSKYEENNINIPIIGFGTEFEDKKIEALYDNIMLEENISLRDFINRKIPELSEEGTIRELYVEPKDMILGDLENDELNESMKKIVIKFSLPPGAYATNIIKGLFENYD